MSASDPSDTKNNATRPSLNAPQTQKEGAALTEETDFPAARQAVREFHAIEQKMADPAIASNPTQLRKLGQRHSDLEPIVSAYQHLLSLARDEQAARELESDDPSLSEEAHAIAEQIPQARTHLLRALIPRDPNDIRNVIMEIKAGTGGEEAALFAGDLLKMYTRYAERRGWTSEIQSLNSTSLGGVKDAQIAFRAPHPRSAKDGVWASLKYEGGVHRVQRIPVTDTQGRIQTSAAGVYVFPEIDDDSDEITIDPKDLRIDTFQASGPGGQGVNTTYSAVRITHLPTGIVVSMQDQRSQIQNRAAGMRVLRSRLLALKHEKEAQKAADARQSQVRNLDRSQRIRTYNFPENRIVDHRTGYKAYNLDQVLAGDLDAVIESDIQADEAERLQQAAKAHSGSGLARKKS